MTDVLAPSPTETSAAVDALGYRLFDADNHYYEATDCVTRHLDPALRTLLHKTIAGVREDYEGLRFNTAIAKLIELNNAVTKLAEPPRSVMEPLVQMVAPVAPHIADELWERMGGAGSLALGPFPVADEALLIEDTVTCVIQIRGKVRDRVDVPADIAEADLRELVLAREKVLAATAEGIRTVIVRPPTLVNVVPM